MKSNLIGTLSLVVASLLLNVGAQAQSTVTANVPFDFTVGTTQLPAGSYRIALQDQQSSIAITNNRTGATMYQHVQREYPAGKTDKMIFQHIGSQYALTEIWGAQGFTGMTLKAHKMNVQSEVASGPSNDSSKQVEIALK
jgi:hypothetical protein